MGADLVGVAGAESHLFREHGEEPERLLSGVKSLISIGVALNKEAVCSGNLRLKNREFLTYIKEEDTWVSRKSTSVLWSG